VSEFKVKNNLVVDFGAEWLTCVKEVAPLSFVWTRTGCYGGYIIRLCHKWQLVQRNSALHQSAMSVRELCTC
jgi:hypothetical protein